MGLQNTEIKPETEPMNKPVIEEEITQEQVDEKVEQVEESLIDYLKRGIKEISEQKERTLKDIDEAEKLKNMLKFYIGRETVNVTTELRVNLLKIHSVELVNTTVEIYRNSLNQALEDYHASIAEMDNALKQLEEQLEKSLANKQQEDIEVEE